MDEKVYFEHGGVQVTNARFKVDAQTYAIRNITSTAAWSKPQGWALAALLVLCAIGGFMSKDGAGAGVLFLLLAAGVFWWARPWHFVKLSTASGEVKALKSRDRNYVLQVVNALNDAMVSQHKSA